MSLRVLIADDHALLRSGLRAILESRADLEVCGEASNGEEAVQKTQDLRPDFVILDITMPVMDGFEATRRIKAARPETPILILSMHSSKEFMRVLQKIGASGYVRKSESAQSLMLAINTICENRTFFPGDM